MLPTDESGWLSALKSALETSDSSVLERLSAALFSRLLDVPVAVARSGFQHGGDAGPAGGERRFRVECKRYRDDTSLNVRELLGEIDQALERDPALEAWVLVSTQSVPEQVVQSVRQKGESLGVPVLVVDWGGPGLPPLAALCAHAPDVVEAFVTPAAVQASRELSALASAPIERLRRDLETWALGYADLRERSHKVLRDIWQLPKTANAVLGQNAAGGAESRRVRRATVHAALDSWWHGPQATDAPAVVVGSDGVGKTWAVLDWMCDRAEQLPIVLVVPSSAATVHLSVSQAGISEFLADRLYEVAQVRDRNHWRRRLERLFKRPADEGPAIAVLIDGLNQRPSIEWLRTLQTLQSPTFEKRVRLIISTRRFHFEERLGRLRSLVAAPVPIQVDPYNDRPGGELDRMLELEHLSRDHFTPELLELARTPRLFRLVVQMRSRLAAGPVSIHQLLWEYGRDTFGVRAGRSFSESDWRAWLQEIAERYRQGVRAFSLRDLSETTARPDLSPDEVYARLSDIVDGRFASAAPGGSVQLTPTVVAHALGAGLAAHVQMHTGSFEEAQADLEQWLDPISGLDQRQEILRAAVSILLESGGDMKARAVGALVSTWLQSQNVPDSHLREVIGLAQYIPEPLLDVVEHSAAPAHASARSVAVAALRSISRADGDALAAILARTRRWLSTVPRDVYPSSEAHADAERSRSERLKKLIGIDRSGPISVLGLDLSLVDTADEELGGAAAAILEGWPLAAATGVFEVAALHMALRRRSESWPAIKWLCYLNNLDRAAVTQALRDLASDVLTRPVEDGVNSALPARVASLLLWLTGEPDDEARALDREPWLEGRWRYEDDYLPNPAKSMFALERRHANEALEDRDLRILNRINRTRDLWCDPTFEGPASFVDELKAAAASVDVTHLTRTIGTTAEDHAFDELEPVLARCAPERLSELRRDWLQSFATRPASERWPCAVTATEGLVLAGRSEAASARALRMGAKDSDDGQEFYAASQFLILETHGLNGAEQARAILESGVADLLLAFGIVLKPMAAEDASLLISQFGSLGVPQLRALLTILGCHRPSLNDDTWTWTLAQASHVDSEVRAAAFRVLTQCDATRFGRRLWQQKWRWSADEHYWTNRYGSSALIEGTRDVPFESVVQSLAPWRILEAARLRGGRAEDVRIAAEAFGALITGATGAVPDPGAQVVVDRRPDRSGPFRVSVVDPSERLEGLAALRAMSDSKTRVEDLNRTIRAAADRIEAARRTGAPLYLVNVLPADLEGVLDVAPDVLEQWLDGMHDVSSTFQSRVRLAEATYLAVCEVLLRRDPTRGAVLWEALSSTLSTQFIGLAEVNELTHMVFRVPDSVAVNALRRRLLALDVCHTDAALFDVAVAAAVNGKDAWLRAMIEDDEASGEAWRRARAVVLKGFTAGNVLPVDEAWPSGLAETQHEDVQRQAARRRYMEACACHWSRAYSEAATADEAYASWVMLLACADRRAYRSVLTGLRAETEDSAFQHTKTVHASLNRHQLERAMRKREQALDRRFLGREISPSVGPWRTPAVRT